MGAPQFGGIFFMITGFHGTHVSIGVIFLLVMAQKVWRGDYDMQSSRIFSLAAKVNMNVWKLWGCIGILWIWFGFSFLHFSIFGED